MKVTHYTIPQPYHSQQRGHDISNFLHHAYHHLLLLSLLFCRSASVSVSLTTGTDEIGRLCSRHLAEATDHFQKIGCRFMPRLSSPYNADGGGGAAASVIAENYCVGENWCVDSAMTKRREEGVRVCIKCVFGLTPKQPNSCSGLGQFEAHSERPHTHTSCQLCESGFGPGWTDFPLQTSFKAICWVLVQWMSWNWHTAET